MMGPYQSRDRKRDIIWRIIDGVSDAEREFQLACGAWPADAYTTSWDTIEDTMNILLAPDKPAVHLAPRDVTGRRA